VDSLVVAPVLLFAAGHAKQDIPQAVDRAIKQCPRTRLRHGNSFVLAPHLGTHGKIIDLSAQKYQQAIGQLAEVPAEETVLVLVGRGSRDRGATAEMLEFSRLRQRRCGLSDVRTAFYAMAQPNLGDSLQRLQTKAFRRIVVQPHLLFSGQILDQIVALVLDAKEKASRQEWVICNHLGPSPEIADVLVERFMQALTR
jgi:sirohydrochlorin ferrochelatase